MSDQLPGFDTPYPHSSVRAIDRVKASFQADLDNLLATIHKGGNLIEMRAAVDAAWLIKEIIVGLDKPVAVLRDTEGKSE